MLCFSVEDDDEKGRELKVKVKAMARYGRKEKEQNSTKKMGN